MKQLLKPYLELAVRDRDGVVFEGRAVAVSSISQLGPFDVLVKHARLVGEIKNELKVKLVSGEMKKWQIKSGILWVDGRGKVEVFLGI